MQLLEFFRSRRGGELAGVLLCAGGVTLAACLLTYNPGDPSAFTTSETLEVSNAIGYYGATFAWILVSFFGFAGLLFPTVLLVLGWNRFWGRALEYLHTKFAGTLLLAITIPALLELTFGSVWFREALIPAGGYIGQELRKAVASNLNVTGAAIVFVTTLLVGLLLATRLSLGSVMLELQKLAVAGVRKLSFAWSHFSERRRRERMKSEVVRKHLQKVPSADDEHFDEESESLGIAPVPVVREVRGHGKFQIRKVTKADLRRAAVEYATRGAEPEARFEEEAEARAAVARPVRAARAAAVPPPAARRAPEADEDDGVIDFDSTMRRSRRATAPVPRPIERKQKPVREEVKSVRQPENPALPPTDLLQEAPRREEMTESVHKTFLETGRLIEDKCREFNVDGEVTAYHPGPVVTTFEFKPSAGVKYAKIVNLSDDLALALRAESMRIERISGSSTVGIEVPNRKRDLISLREIIDSEAFNGSSSLMTLALGKDIHGEPIVTDLARMPHLLVAGATGAGKSVGLNSMIVSLLYKALPSQLRLLMIDPKMVELKIYEDVPHLIHPIITDPKLASTALTWTVNEMENRYRTLAECGVRNIDQYNQLLRDPAAWRRARKSEDSDEAAPEAMQYIVVIIDEFADLMMVASKDVEDSVTRLAQKARAVGIHLIIATQRPSVDVITGVIKANFPSRISYQVASKIDSRTILDAQGAEKLLGSGDMLFLPPGTARIRRIHGAYVSEKEIARIVDHVKQTQGEPAYIEEITKDDEESGDIDGFEMMSDPKYDDAVRIVLQTGQASASYLQRRMKLGYSRAARLIEMMEANGIVGPSQGSKPREILIRADDYPGVMEL